MKKFIALSLSTILTLSSLTSANAYSCEYPCNSNWEHDKGNYNWDSTKDTDKDWNWDNHEENSSGYDYYDEYSEEPSEEVIPEEEETAYDMADELDEFYQDMEEDSTDLPSKSLHSVLKKMDEALRFIVEALQDAEEGKDHACNQKLREGIALLERAIYQCEVRECRTDGLYKKRCIPQEIVNQYLDEMKLMLEQLKEFLLADEDEDGVADVCTWEDFLSNFEDSYEEDYEEPYLE